MSFDAGLMGGRRGAAYAPRRSLQFGATAGDQLTRMPAGAGNRRTWTFSVWGKCADVSAAARVFLGADASSGDTLQYVNAALEVDLAGVARIVTTALFRDPAAFGHIVWQYDSPGEVTRLYYNGKLMGSASVALNADSKVNDAVAHYIGQNGMSARYFDGVLSDVVLVDGQVLAPTDFAEEGAEGVWVPKRPSVSSWGANGFWLDGEISGGLALDKSGNDNHWTVNGVTECLDSPGDKASADAGNYARWNSLFFRRTGNYKPIFSEAATKVAGQSGVVSHTGTTAASSGRHYAEFRVTDGTSGATGPGVVRAAWNSGLAESYAHNYGGAYYSDTGARAYNNSTDAQTAPSSNRIGIEVDFANDEVEFFIVQSNSARTSQGGKLTAADGIAFGGHGIFTATVHDTSVRTVKAHFSPDEWWGTPNGGYEPLCSAYLPAKAPKKPGAHIGVLTWSGTSGERALTGLGFRPDFAWIKQRSSTPRDHNLVDAVRGLDKNLSTNLSAAEETAACIVSFDTDGLTLAGGGFGNTNLMGTTYVGWFVGGLTQKTSGWVGGTITPIEERYDAALGFSIIKYTGNGVAGATIPHSLGQAPAMMIIKALTATADWPVWHRGLPSAAYCVLLNDAGGHRSHAAFNNTVPTSSVFSIGPTAYMTNYAGVPCIAYLFAATDAIRVGSYIGNGSADGPFVDLGGEPLWMITKRTDAAGFLWAMQDGVRSPFNPTDQRLFPNEVVAETSDGNGLLDFMASGFKIRNAHGGQNANGGTYIYLAFLKHYFGGANVAQGRAR